MLTELTGFDHDVVAFKVSQQLTYEDMTSTLIPAIEQVLADHVCVRLWLQFSRDFTGFSLKALWSETCFNLLHLDDFSKIVVIADTKEMSAGIISLWTISACPFKVFALDQTEQARGWFTQVA
ncbi:STAS/SEC14 domain-containing protein [Shewanella sp. NIFS-20-20]|uniref:STAS/SEC14 domain-containing protein n=1 Tax=Shewanella sp. NIFS-20-20 TaxID=2853806 RepID=UPI001C47A0B2|nr:STAS/SEC14 domain-containing protein [Shewanella sp. NIFS-20-20]MBV7314381.1 STAS/SEC14 domain-containing protein [Shewanella sp. NIFS-20-20]